MAKFRRQNAPRRIQDAHKTAQEALRPPPRRSPDAPKIFPRRPKTAPRQPQGDPKTRPRRPQDAPRHPQERRIRGSIWDGNAISNGIPSRPRLWSVLGSILGGFGMDFWSFFPRNLLSIGELLRSKIVSRTFQVRASKKSGASRSMSNQVYLGVVLEPKTPPRRPKTLPKTPRRGKTPPRRPKRCLGAAQDAPKSIQIPYLCWKHRKSEKQKKTKENQ